MKFPGLLVFFCLFCFATKAQTDTLSSRSIFNRNHFTFSLQHGFTRGESEPVSGPLALDPRTGYVYHANLNYTTHLSDKIGATIGTGIGVFPFNFELYELDLGRMQYFDDVDYNPFVSFRGEINYRHKLNDKYFLNGFAGASAVSLQEFEMSTGASTSTQPDYIYRVNINYEKGWKPLAHIGTGISRVLPNHDLLTLRVDYNHSFRDFYSGTYSIMPNTPAASNGRYLNRGNHLNLGLAYTFTRAEKSKTTQQYYKDGGRKNADKAYKIEKRKIHEGSTMLALHGGLTFPINRAKDPNGIFQNASMVNLMPYFSLEHNLKKNFYAEAGFGFQEYFSAMKMKGDFGTSGGNAFVAYQTSIGGGKRLIGKNNNYNYLNLCGGLVLNMIDRQVGNSGGMWGSNVDQNNDTIFQFHSEDHVLNRITPLFYIGASKDFRISGGFYLSLLYRYHQGFMKLYEQRITYSSVDFTAPQKATISMNGSFHTFQLGAKFNLGNLPERNIKRKFIPFEKGTFLVSVSPGFIYNQNRTTYQSTNSNGSFNQSWNTFSPAIGVEYFLNNKNYLEARANYYSEYTFTMGMKIAGLSVGAGRRLDLANGLNLFNIQAGLSFSQILASSGVIESNTYHNLEEESDGYYISTYDAKEMKGSTTSTTIRGTDTLYNNITTFGLEKTFIPAVYIGVSKDFRITNKLSAGILYNRYFGSSPFYKEEIRSANFENNSTRTEKTVITGTASQLLFTAKYRLFSDQ